MLRTFPIDSQNPITCSFVWGTPEYSTTLDMRSGRLLLKTCGTHFRVVALPIMLLRRRYITYCVPLVAIDAAEKAIKDRRGVKPTIE